MTTHETEIYKSIRERYKTVIPLVCRHPIFQPEREVGMMQESNEYVDALYSGIINEFYEKGLFLVYLCAPLKPTYQKSGRDHILDALHHVSQITGSEYNGKKFAIWIPHYHGLTMSNEFINPAAREFAMLSNKITIWQYRPTLLQVGERISEGMRTEIACAKLHKCNNIDFEKFKEYLQNLPSQEEVEIIYHEFIESIPSEILNHPAFDRKKKYEFIQPLPRFYDTY